MRATVKDNDEEEYKENKPAMQVIHDKRNIIQNSSKTGVILKLIKKQEEQLDASTPFNIIILFVFHMNAGHTEYHP